MDDLRGWTNIGRKIGATHVLVMYDGFLQETYPRYVMPGEDPNVRRTEGPMQTCVDTVVL